MNVDLLRQRRNLIAVSGVLLVFDFAQVKIVKVSVLGTELLVGNVQVLMFCAWVLWAYFTLRYYQYWRVEPNKYIRNSFIKQLEKYARSYSKIRDQDEIGQSCQYRFCRVGLVKWAYIDSKYNPERGDVVDGLGIRLPLWMVTTLIAYGWNFCRDQYTVCNRPCSAICIGISSAHGDFYYVVTITVFE